MFAHLVSAQLAGLDELPVAQLAGVRLLAGVGSRVPRQAVGRVKTLVAHDACVLTLVSAVHLRSVARQVAARAQLLAALVALKAHAQVLVLQVRRQKTLPTQQSLHKLVCKYISMLCSPHRIKMVSAKVTQGNLRSSLQIIHILK
jgi:hypothetical protein